MECGVRRSNPVDTLYPMRCALHLVCLIATGLCMKASAQIASAPASAMVPGLPPDEYVDVTGDGRADLLITGRTIHSSDPQQPGYLGQYKLGVRTLNGTAMLMWSTPSNQRWFTLDSAARLDTAELAARIHFKQLSWTDEDQPTEFWLLERPFGPAITKEQDGWYGTGDHHDGRTMVLRSANERGTSIAAFRFELPYPYGRVKVNQQEAVRVPNGFGEEGDPVPTRPVVKDGFDFGHERDVPEVMVPPGLAPDEPVDLNEDGVIDVVIRSVDPLPGKGSTGHTVRGVSPLPGTALLIAKEGLGVWGPFILREGEALTPEGLNAGLQFGALKWSSSEDQAFIEVLRHAHGTSDGSAGWSSAYPAFDGTLVYRTNLYGRAQIGALSVEYTLPGGVLGVRPEAWVEEGGVLQVR